MTLTLVNLMAIFAIAGVLWWLFAGFLIVFLIAILSTIRWP